MNAIVFKDKEKGRGRLLSSALKLFSQKSFDSVSVREICDDANANVSLISFYFGGKDSLLDTIFQEQLLSSKFEGLERILSTPESIDDMKTKLKVFLESYLDFYLENKEVFSLYLEELEKGHAVSKKLLPETFGKVWDQLTVFLEESKEKQFLNQGIDTRVLIFQIMGPITSLVLCKGISFQRTGASLEDKAFSTSLVNQIVYAI